MNFGMANSFTVNLVKNVLTFNIQHFYKKSRINLNLCFGWNIHAVFLNDTFIISSIQ